MSHGRQKRPNGEGSLRRRGRRYFALVSFPGRGRREVALGTESRPEAVAALRRLVAQIEDGDPTLFSPPLTVADAYQRLVQDYKIRGRRTSPAKRWAHLEPVFGATRVQNVTSAMVADYVEGRLSAGAAPATVAREIAALRRALRLLRDDGVRFPVFPRFPTITENNVRPEFFSPEQYERLREELPAHLRPMLTLGYWLGWRRSEILSLQWRHVDLDAGTVRLDAGTTKNLDGRYVHLPAPALAELRAWREETAAIERRLGIIIQAVIHRHGRPVRDHYGAWRAACERAGVPGRWFHDLRRSAVRNYVRAGVSEKIAMGVTGHRTRAVFERYNIVTDGDLRTAAARVSVGIAEELRKSPPPRVRWGVRHRRQVVEKQSAGDGGRTRMGECPRDFKSLVSADFTTPA